MSNADWYAKKLAEVSGQPAVQQGRPQNLPPMPPSQQPLPQMPAFQPQTSRTLPSASQTATCPDCGSSNYMSVQNAAPRCYDCGYPVQQSGSRYGNLAGAHVEGATKQATGNNATNNWNPITSADQAVGRING